MMKRTLNTTPRMPRRHGFSLVEILVVVAVILALIGILIPSMSAFQKHARIASTTARLNAIRTGLEAYFSEFGAYPPSISAPAYGNQIAGRGQAMLAQGLLGYMPATVDGAGPPNVGDPPFGFRTRTTANPSMGGLGKVYPPYVATEPKTYKQTVVGVDESFLDPFEQEILYYRSTTFLRTSPVTVTKIFGTAFDNGGAGPYSYFVIDDCTQKPNPLPPPAAPFIPIGLNPATDGKPGFYKSISGGDSNVITGGGTITGGTSYLLISAGPDLIYFTADDIVMGK